MTVEALLRAAKELSRENQLWLLKKLDALICHEWQHGVDEALAQVAAGDSEVYAAGAEFLRVLDPARAAAEGI